MQTRATDSTRVQGSRDFSKRLLILAVAGGAAFWITDFVIAVSPIGVTYEAAFFISSLSVALSEALVGGLVIAFCVSFLLLRFPNSIPGKDPVHKALILSFGVMALIEILSTLGNPSRAAVYLLLDTGMNVPRFLALGLAIGYFKNKTERF